jgi:hypothetical protein
LVVLEISKPYIVIAMGLGEQGIEVDKSYRDDWVLDLRLDFILGLGEDSKSSGSHRFSSLSSRDLIGFDIQTRPRTWYGLELPKRPSGA